MELGGAGGICVASHLLGNEFRRICDLVAAGDVEGARALDAEVRPVYHVVNTLTTNPIPIKAALALAGHSVGGLACRWSRPTRRNARPFARCSNGTATSSARDDPVRIIPLGGLGEVGKNMTVFEQGEERILIDAGLSFPRDEMLGVDLVLPDFSYLKTGGHLRAIVLTHGHEDHVGALPYVIREVGCPQVWGTRLTLGLIKSKLDEHGLVTATDSSRSTPRASGSGSARSTSSSPASPTRSPMPWPSPCTPTRARSSTPATTSSTTPRSTATAPTWRASPGSARPASTSSWPTRPTPSGEGSPSPSRSSPARCGGSSATRRAGSS